VTEHLQYELIKSYEGFELRQYSAYVLAQVQVRGDFITAGNSAFSLCCDTSRATTKPARSWQ